MYMKRKSNFDLQGEELSGRLITYQKIPCQAKIFRLKEIVAIQVMLHQGKARMNNKTLKIKKWIYLKKRIQRLWKKNVWWKLDIQLVKPILLVIKDHMGLLELVMQHLKHNLKMIMIVMMKTNQWLFSKKEIISWATRIINNCISLSIFKAFYYGQAKVIKIRMF